MRKRMNAAWLLLVALVLSLIPLNALAASELDKAAAYVTEQGIYQGDQSGNLNLDSGLTRAELAAILTRIRGDGQKVQDNYWAYAIHCFFTDVADWAKPYVGYCAANELMNGYSYTTFGSNDAVTPGQACTVILRHLGYAETDWDYTTAIQKATAVGIAPADGLTGSTVTRGTMAILIYRAASNPAPTQSTPDAVQGQTVADGSGSVSDTKLTYKLIDGRDLSREDYSQKANPAIFNGSYTRGMYNALYQSYIDRDIIWPGNNGKTAAENFNPYYSYASANAGSYEVSLAYEAILTHISADYGFRISAEPYASDLWKYPGYFIVCVMKTDYSLDNETLSIIKQAESQTPQDAIRSINDHVRSRITYNAQGSAGVEQVLNTTKRVNGACGTYAKAFKYLCDVVNIPAFIINGDNHAWVMVYVDGEWYHCDPTNDRVLVETIKYSPYHPHNIEFMKEILVPGSAK